MTLLIVKQVVPSFPVLIQKTKLFSPIAGPGGVDVTHLLLLLVDRTFSQNSFLWNYFTLSFSSTIKPWKLWLQTRTPIWGSRDVRVWYFPSFHSKSFHAHVAWYERKTCPQKQEETQDTTFRGAATVRSLYPFWWETDQTRGQKETGFCLRKSQF